MPILRLADSPQHAFGLKLGDFAVHGGLGHAKEGRELASSDAGIAPDRFKNACRDRPGIVFLRLPFFRERYADPQEGWRKGEYFLGIEPQDAPDARAEPLGESQIAEDADELGVHRQRITIEEIVFSTLLEQIS